MPWDSHPALLAILPIAHKEPPPAQPMPTPRRVRTRTDGSTARTPFPRERRYRFFDSGAGINGRVYAGVRKRCDLGVEFEVHGCGAFVGAVMEGEARELAVGNLHGVFVDGTRDPVVAFEDGLRPL